MQNKDFCQTEAMGSLLGAAMNLMQNKDFCQIESPEKNARSKRRKLMSGTGTKSRTQDKRKLFKTKVAKMIHDAYEIVKKVQNKVKVETIQDNQEVSRTQDKVSRTQDKVSRIRETTIEKQTVVRW